jgi:peptidoglycan/xylan/chitin deacetylase (PgdA/CDA1 family)
MIALWHRLPDQFEEQLGAIAGLASAYHFDDGHDDVLRAADALEAHGLRGVFFVTSGWTGLRGYATGNQLREIERRGHELGNHTVNHFSMLQLRRSARQREIAVAQADLAEITGYEPTRFAWPFGLHDPDCDRLAETFGFGEVRDISDVLQSAALKTAEQVLAEFRERVAA